MATGAQLVALAMTRLKEKYVNVLVPKDNPNWHGPWDCAEFASWVVFQKMGKLYGCVNNNGDPASTEAYSGSWVRDAKDGTLLPSTEDEAVSTPGVILIRKPPAAGKMGHVAISDGRGLTVEAAGEKIGVAQGKVRGRLWHYVVKVPGVTYSSTNFTTPAIELPLLLALEAPPVVSPLVRKVQSALKAAGFSPGAINGEYGLHTLAAVGAFQTSKKLVSDGIVGPKTAKLLGVEWPK